MRCHGLHGRRSALHEVHLPVPPAFPVPDDDQPPREAHVVEVERHALRVLRCGSCLQSGLRAVRSAFRSVGVLRSTGITRLHSYYDPFRLLPLQSLQLCVPGATLGNDPRSGRYLRLLAILSIRAVRSHPGELDDCTRLCLHHPCWLRPNWQVGHPRIHLGAETGSRLRITAHTVRRPGAPPRRSPFAAPGWLHVSQALHMVEPFIQQGRSGLA